MRDLPEAARPLVALGIASNVGRFGGSCVDWVAPAVGVGLGRAVALYFFSSTSYQIR